MTPRDRLVAALRDAVDVPWIDAAWIGGAEAFGRLDEWSDLDLQLLCDPARADDAFALVERQLEGLGGIEAVWEPPAGADYRQRFYRVAGFPEWCMLDLCLMVPGRLDPWMDPERHGTPTVWFDRVGALRPLRDEGLDERLADRRRQMVDRAELIGHLPAKSLARGQVLEAVDTYHRMLLVPLMELLRARHCPRRQDYGMRYARLDLPADVVDRLERLALPSAETLPAFIEEARAWIRELS
ncbi:MAG: hypothetical protein KC621_25660 [Myxococcales bacterium]|nr:hypothetical protein [Myxococcales bacterium]